MTHANPEFRAFMDRAGLKMAALFPELEQTARPTAWAIWNGRKRASLDSAHWLTRAVQRVIAKNNIPLQASIESLFPPRMKRLPKDMTPRRNIHPKGDDCKRVTVPA